MAAKTYAKITTKTLKGESIARRVVILVSPERCEQIAGNLGATWTADLASKCENQIKSRSARFMRANGETEADKAVQTAMVIKILARHAVHDNGTAVAVDKTGNVKSARKAKTSA